MRDHAVLEDPVVIEVWTVYDHPRNIALFAAVHSIVDDGADLIENDDLGEHIKVSSDIKALRRQLRYAGFRCVGRHPLDVPDIIEVWLKRNKKPTTGRRMAGEIQPKNSLKRISESLIRYF